LPHVSMRTEICVWRLSFFLSSPSPVPVPLFRALPTLHLWWWRQNIPSKCK
jgi:hypothetical protein